MIEEVRRAAVVAVGDELIEGRYPDTNSGEIAQALLELGIDVDRFEVVGDDRRLLAETLARLGAGYGIVVASGGIGPTLDDVTREAAADAAEVGLEVDPGVLSGLRERWTARGGEMPQANARQALFPSGAQIMPNACGTAPGFRVWVQGGTLAVLPGPPAEMRDMLACQLVPWIERTCGRGRERATQHFYLAGVPESQFADVAGSWMQRGAVPRMSVTAHHGVLRVVLTSQAATGDGARGQLEERALQFRERFGEAIFSEREPLLERALAQELMGRELSIATAESCTGGLVARLLTDAPGVSSVFREGWVTYTNRAKIERLGVPPELIERHGAVSEEVASAMAAGAARASGARIAVAVTGVAGPGGGSEDKPVGLVWFAVHVDGTVTTRERRFAAVGRDHVRLYAAHSALDLVRRNLPR